MLASRLVGARGRVYAFEPADYNLGLLRLHVRWNRLANTTVMPLALGAEKGVATFGGPGSSQTLHVGGGADVVTVSSIRDLLREGLRAPDVMKLDAEGAEGDILEAGAASLPPTAILMVAAHSRELYERTAGALVAQGFEIIASAALRDCLRSAGWAGDPDFVAVGPARPNVRDRIRELKYFRGQPAGPRRESPGDA